MKILADENIPYVSELFSPLGEVTLRPGRTMSNEDIRRADILLVRSVTKVNEKLLENSHVQFVGTCTIGMDHMDTRYLEKTGIKFASAPGCNANGVVQYVVSALASLSLVDFSQVSISTMPSAAIVGGGNVGSRVYRALEGLGIECVCVDPFIDPKDPQNTMRMASFDAVYEADIVCVHTPLTFDGPYPTYKMFDLTVLDSMRSGAVLLNAGRGEVIDNSDLLEVLLEGKDLRVILDVWDNEPNINKVLMNKVTLGTPHIAGYSFEGRVGGSLMIFDALCKHLKFNHDTSRKIRSEVTTSAFGQPQVIRFSRLEEVVLESYDVREDYQDLIGAEAQLPESFDSLRKNYPKRREYSHYCCRDVPEDYVSLVQAAGFLIYG